MESTDYIIYTWIFQLCKMFCQPWLVEIDEQAEIGEQEGRSRQMGDSMRVRRNPPIFFVGWTSVPGRPSFGRPLVQLTRWMSRGFWTQRGLVSCPPGALRTIQQLGFPRKNTRLFHDLCIRKPRQNTFFFMGSSALADDSFSWGVGT